MNTDSIDALYFDGRQGRGQPVRLQWHQGELLALDRDSGHTLQRWPAAQLRWPERTRHGQRVVHLQPGGQLQALDAAAFDAWRGPAGDSRVVRLQQNWRAVAVSLLAVLGLAAAAYLWGVPWAARAVVALTPPSVDNNIGDAVLAQIETELLKPSALPVARRDALQIRFGQALAAAYPAGDRPAYQLHFRAANERLGANALALPGGAIIITDALVKALDGADDTLLGVFAHEIGHLRHRHGMRSVAQVSLLAAAAGIAIGDFSGIAAGGAALLGQLGYSRDAEREADDEAIRVLKANGISPRVMTVLFERLKPQPGQAGALGIALRSHPMDEERVARFRAAAD